jgi:hypothetical protein
MRWAILSIFLGMAAFGDRASGTACWFDHGAIVVPAAFGDIAGDFLIDPAAPKSQLNATNAQMFGILTPTAQATLKLAGLRLRDFEMTSTDLGARERPFAAGLVGVIGADALSGFVTEIQTAPCRITLSRRAGRPWPIRLPLKAIGGAFAVPAALSDGVTTRAGWFAVTTAQPGVTIAEAKLSREPPKDADPAWPPAQLRALSVGGVLFENIPAGVLGQAPPGLSGALGEDVWWTFRMRLDPKRGWLELSPSPRFSARN